VMSIRNGAVVVADGLGVERPLGSRRRGARTAVITAMVLTLSACALERGWTTKDQSDFRDAVCGWAGLAARSAGCSCLLDAARAAYPKADDFLNSTEPSEQLERGWAACGLGISD